MIRRLLLVSALITSAATLLRAADPELWSSAAPAPLPPTAAVGNWPHPLGPAWDNHSVETVPAAAPRSVWRRRKGSGYAMPIAADGRVWLFHRLGDQDHLDCCTIDSGELLWRRSTPSDFTDRFGYGNGPRASPVLAEGRVYTVGARGLLSCVSASDGAPLWQRELHRDWAVMPPYFGVGSTPLVIDGRVLINLGAHEGPSAIALDSVTGATLWESAPGWGASYACPLPIAGDFGDGLLVFAGGPSEPPDGGLMLFECTGGDLLGQLPWRSHMTHSVNAASPVRVGDDAVLISASYRLGSALIDVARDGSLSTRWTAPVLGCHWSTPVVVDGSIYGIDGRDREDAALVCLDLASGEERWRAQRLPLGEHLFAHRAIARAMLLVHGGGLLALNEDGLLIWFAADPEALQCQAVHQLFDASETWSGPCLHRGLLVVAQNAGDRSGGQPPAWQCFDVRPLVETDP